MSRNYTPNLGLLTVSPDEPLTTGDLERLFGSNLNAIDTSAQALRELALSLADAGYTPVQPVTITGNALQYRVENASTLIDIPAELAKLPARTPVRITNFTMTLTSAAALLDFYDLLDTLYGIAADGTGLTKAQMRGKIRLTGSGNNKIIVSGAQTASWAARYPSVTVIPQRIENKVYYMSYDGLELLYEETLSTETIYDDGSAEYPDAAYSAIPAKTSSESGYMYSFRGWSTSSNSSVADAVLTEISQDMTVYAAYAYVRDIAPTLSVSAYSTAAGTPATVAVTAWGAYDKITALSAIAASGNTITANPGDGILSVSETESGGESVTAVTVTPNDAFFDANGWALEVSDLSGSCTRSVFFPLRDYPVFRARNGSAGNGDPVVLDVLFNGWNLLSYTCSYQAPSSSGGTIIVSGNWDQAVLTPGNGIGVNGNIVTITPDFTPQSVSASYLTFSRNGESVNINVKIFS